MAKSNFQQIVDFHLAVDGHTPPQPVKPNPDILAIRRTLIREEYAEVMHAFDGLEAGQDDAAALVQLAHEMADLLYVVYGTFAACGIDADAVYTTVHQANMRKIGGPRRADGKLLKPADWQPADVAGVMAQMGEKENGRVPGNGEYGASSPQ